MNICIFEDDRYRKFFPLAHFRPVYDLKCGMATFSEKILRSFDHPTVILHSRDYLTGVLKERYPNWSVNEIPSDAKTVLFINGRLLLDKNAARRFEFTGKDVVYTKSNTVVAAWLSSNNLSAISKSFSTKPLALEDLANIERQELPDVKLIEFPWDLVTNNSAQLTEDFKIVTGGTPRIDGKVYDGVHLMNKSQIHISEGAKIKPGVVLDAEEGPIYIGKNVKVMPNAVIQGPAFIGDNSLIKVGAKVYENTTIGETCKVGGEVEESIIHAYSNKQHEGFIGHAYLGEWVNIGADSNNSDLKNDYGTVKVYNDDELVDTGSQFVGLTMGDHSKCGINSMFNTGTVVGACCNVYGAGLPPKYVPSFSWGGASEGFETYKLGKAIEVARRVMARRKMILSNATEQLFKKVFELTEKQRAIAGIRPETE